MSHTSIKIFKFMTILGLFISISCQPKPNSETISKKEKNRHLLLAKMSTEEKISQLQGAWLRDLLDGKSLSLDSCRKKIPYGIGHLAQFSSSTDLNPDELKKVIWDLQQYLIHETPNGIPAIFHEEAISGFAAKGATTLPQQIGIGCTWNPDLLRENTAMSAKLMRKVGATQALSPMLDICRNSHWGRIEESFGEEPYFIAKMGLAFVKGLQGEDLSKGVAATTKHFAGYAGGTDNEKVFFEETLLPHEATVRFGNVQSAMAGYHTIKGIPCSANKELLVDILRTKLGFDGVVISDFWSVKQVYTKYKYAKNDKDAAIKSITAGLDVELPFGMSFPYLKEALDEGLIDQKIIDTAVQRVLLLKERLGLLNNEILPFEEKKIDFDPPENRKRAYESACQSIVLLKNNGVLPISTDIKKIAVVGPNAAAVQSLLGDYSYQSLAAYWWKYPVDPKNPKLVTLLDGLKANVKKGVEITYERGCDWTKSMNDEIEKVDNALGDERSKNLEYLNIKDLPKPDVSRAIQISVNSDVIIAAMGEQLYLVGEGRDRKDIRLPGEQEDFVKQLIATGKPVILVLFGGRPQIITNIESRCAAILQAWFPGEEGGNALADILLGKVNPSGKLTLTYPRTNKQAPIWYSKGYDSLDQPMYPFGYGLSYTSYKYKDLKMPKSYSIEEKQISISFEIENLGDFDGAEIAQLYVSPPKEIKELEPIELKGFVRVFIEKKKKKRITIKVSPKQLAYYANGKWIIKPGVYEFKIGASSTDIRLSGKVELKGNKKILNQRNVLFSENSIE